MRESVEMKNGVSERPRADAALRWNEERYRTLFDLGPVAVYCCDASGVIQEFNRRAVELWGCEPVSGDTDKRSSFRRYRQAVLWAPLAMTREPALTAKRLRILIVDDNRDAAGMLAMLLQFSGHETHMAHDGVEAVEATSGQAGGRSRPRQTARRLRCTQTRSG